ncbi:MAG: ion channel [Candidatus Woesearchaeota archaeon]|jgi:potassium channel LctB
MVKRVIKKVREFSEDEFKSKATGTIKKHFTFFDKLDEWLYEPPLLKVPLVLLSVFILELLVAPGDANNSLFFHSLKALLFLIVSIYLVFFIVHLIRKSFKTLLKAKNMWTLFFGYALFIFSIIFFFSSVYDIVERTDMGYIKYGQCSDSFNAEIMHADQLASHSYFYFSAVTLFTVGYGDICPMGAAKTVAIINSFVGNFINVVLMVWIISNYLKRQETEDEIVNKIEK